MQLIRVEEREGKKLVSGRELHEFLEVESNFTTWFSRMCEYGFEEEVDFIPQMEESNGGRPKVDFIINIDMAKEISMIQRTDKGKEARRYFIECEKQVKQLTELDLIIQSAKALQTVTDRLEDTENKVELLDKKFDSVVTLESGKQRTIQKAIACKVLERFDNIKIPLTFQPKKSDFDKLKRKLFSSIHRELKNKFGVSSYKDIKVVDYELALNFINNWIESYEVREG